MDELTRLIGNVVELTDGPVVLQGMPSGIAVLQKGDRLKLVDVRRSPDRKAFLVEFEYGDKAYQTMMEFPSILLKGIA